MYDICCLGHITLDKVVTPKAVAHIPGGTSFYFSHAIHQMDVSYCLVTAVAQTEIPIVSDLRAKGIEVKLLPSAHTVYFENNYAANPDHRIQKVLQKSDPFVIDQLMDVQANIFHLGPLLGDDIPVALIRELSKRGKISLDVQGYLREVRNQDVHAIDWAEKKEALQYVDILKANESEMESITGHTNVLTGAKVLCGWGVKEVVITLGSLGSVIYNDNLFYIIPAYTAEDVVDATGCGDTYMAGYLSQRVKNIPIQEAGEFAAAMATLKIESSGPFTGTRQDVRAVLRDSMRRMFFADDLLQEGI